VMRVRLNVKSTVVQRQERASSSQSVNFYLLFIQKVAQASGLRQIILKWKNLAIKIF
jgi:hypothetical protein